MKTEATRPACPGYKSVFDKPKVEPKTLGEWVQLELELEQRDGVNAREEDQGKGSQDS